MAAPMDSDDDESFATLGTPLPDIDDDAPPKKPVSVKDLAVKDSKGRTRFHGAFTGGFSAGHFNTVGSKEGFTPSTFISSREKKSADQQQFKPEDFMDDEDFGEYGIAPRKLVTADTYTSEERRKRRLDQVTSITSGSIISGEPALADLILPEKLTIGIKLLRKLGWKEGQGLGPRELRKKKTKPKKAAVKVYGCALPPTGSDNDDDSSEEDAHLDVTFAPKDTNPISMVAKDNVHGLGYSGLDPKAALPSTHINLFAPPPISKSGRKGITGQAFGIGALEEDDEDIYAIDHISNYDVTMEINNEQENLYGWTAPGRHKRNEKQKTPIGYVGRVLEGFTLSEKPLKQKRGFGPPILPKNFKPVHRFLKPVQEPNITGSENRKEKLNAVSRGLILGDTPIVNSVFDLVSKQDQRRIQTATQLNQNRDETISQITSTQSDTNILGSKFISEGAVSQNTEQRSSDFSFTTGANNPEKSVTSDSGIRKSRFSSRSDQDSARQTPLFQGAISFKPFAKDPTKQERYEKYIALTKTGKRDAYEKVAEIHMTEWEREREKEEFVRASTLYKPMSGMIASRFTSAKYSDNMDDKVDVPAEDGGNKDDKTKAAEMKMYGRLTRDTFEWHPDRLLCQRFNVPDPYPGSSVVGLLTVKRDKYSVFNFLDFGTAPQPEGTDLKALPAPEASRDQEMGSSKTKTSGFQMTIQSQKPAPLKSIFSVLMQDPPSPQMKSKPQMAEKEVTLSGSSSAEQQTSEVKDEPPQDLFAAIFGNTDSENSSDEDQDVTAIETVKQTNTSSIHPSETSPNSDKKIDILNTSERNSENRMSESNTDIGDLIMITETAVNSEQTLPGELQAIQDRLTTSGDQVSSHPELDDTEEYGPSLPPTAATSGTCSLITPETRPSWSGEGDHPQSSSGHYQSSSRHKDSRTDASSSRKSKHKHKDKHKHKKEKKAKRKKDRHKKKERKTDRKRRKNTSTDDDDSNSDVDTASSDDSNVPSNKELLQKLKSVGSSRRHHYEDFL